MEVGNTTYYLGEEEDGRDNVNINLCKPR